MDNQPKVITSQIKDVEFGQDVTIVQPLNLYGCKIGSGSFIGPFTEIQRNVSIGHNTKIQSHTFICELVEIGDFCFIGHGVMFVNDTFKDGRPAGGDQTKWGKIKIGNYVCIGSNATVLPVEITDHVIIGAGAVVTKDIFESGIYAGNPAKKIRPL